MFNSLNKHFTKSLKDGKGNLSIIIKDNEDDLQEIHNGKEKVKDVNDINTVDENNISDDDIKEKEISISFTKDILPYIIPLTCILTVKNSNTDFVKMLNDINENKELLDVFNDQCFIWWNKKDLINLIKNIVEKYFDKSSNTYNISIQFKMSLKSLIDNPKELLELITECLKPKDVEKKQFGEVFTPINLVNEMLDKLPTEVWTNKNLKWLDPSVGMGNFPIAVYLRLMESLKNEIPDDKLRKKHILENMLYMCELNKKNVFICNQIFDINNEYKINLYKGDFLEFNPLNTFGVKNFDIIIGNPPYQDSNATGDNKLYLSFIKFSLNLLIDNGLLLFITPTNVKNYLTCQNKNRNYIDNFYNIKFLSINTSNKYFPQIATYFAYFVIEKKIIKECMTQVEFIRNTNTNQIETDIIQIKKEYNLPLCISQKDISIINKTSNLIENTHIIFDIKKAEYNIAGKKSFQRIRTQHITIGKISKTQTNDFKFKIIDKINKSNPLPGIFYYNDNQMIDYGKRKIIMCTGGYLMPSYDDTGQYNLSDNMIYMLCSSENEYKSFEILVNSNLVKYLNKVTMTDNIHGRDTVIMNMKSINLNNISNDDDIYKIYNITNDEKKIIELTINKK